MNRIVRYSVWTLSFCSREEIVYSAVKLLLRLVSIASNVALTSKILVALLPFMFYAFNNDHRYFSLVSAASQDPSSPLFKILDSGSRFVSLVFYSWRMNVLWTVSSFRFQRFSKPFGIWIHTTTELGQWIWKLFVACRSGANGPIILSRRRWVTMSCFFDIPFWFLTFSFQTQNSASYNFRKVGL